MTIPKSPGTKHIFIAGNLLLSLLTTNIKKVSLSFDSWLPCISVSGFSKIRLLILCRYLRRHFWISNFLLSLCPSKGRTESSTWFWIPSTSSTTLYPVSRHHVWEETQATLINITHTPSEQTQNSSWGYQQTPPDSNKHTEKRRVWGREADPAP